MKMKVKMKGAVKIKVARKTKGTFGKLAFTLGLCLLPLIVRMGQASAAISEMEFNRVLDKIETLYKDEIFQVTGRELNLSRNWNQYNFLTVDSSIQHPGRETSDITITGLLPHHQVITSDAFALMVCHEFGHHLGGLPRQPQKLVQWSSVEGQADYWAVLKCLRRYMEDDDNGKIVGEMTVPTELSSRCQSQFAQQAHQLICERSMMAGLSIASYFNATTAKLRPVDYRTPDLLKVTATKIKYGSPQCRLDTYISASLHSEAGVNQQLDESGKNGERPRCWFSPAPL